MSNLFSGQTTYKKNNAVYMLYIGPFILLLMWIVIFLSATVKACKIYLIHQFLSVLLACKCWILFLWSGRQSTPTQDRNKDIELRCSRLEHDLHSEKRKTRDLERRLQLEKNKNEDLMKEMEHLRKENLNLRY